MHIPELILTLTCGLSAAVALGYGAHRLGLSPIVGYLLAGIAVGPYTPGFVADHKLAEQLSEIGVILLMFGVGLHFHLEDLLAVRGVAIPGAVVQILGSASLGLLIGQLFGFDWPSAIVFGLCISVASTVVLTRVLADNQQLHTPLGHTAVGWLVVQDLYAVLVLVLMEPIYRNSGDLPQLGKIIALILLKMTLLVFVVLFVGGRAIPVVLHHIAQTRSRELFTLSVLVIALGIAVGSAMLFGVSMALGAFLAGMVVGRSDFSLRAATDAVPMRDAFAVLFFVSIGMLFDPRTLQNAPGLVLVTLLVVLVGTPVLTLLAIVLLGRPLPTAVGVGLALAQIGEFSFIVGRFGRELKILDDTVLPVLVVVAIVTISVNPLIYRLSLPFERWIRRQPWLSRQLARIRLERVQITQAIEGEQAQPEFRAVVVGYGPVGQTLVRILSENRITPTVIEMNLETVRKLRGQGWKAIYGDASHADTLRAAEIETAGTLFLSSSSINAAEEVVRLARELNPTIRVIARSAYLRERSALLGAGANEVYAGEGEVALALAESVLRQLGATAEQIDRERERVRVEIRDPK